MSATFRPCSEIIAETEKIQLVTIILMYLATDAVRVIYQHSVNSYLMRILPLKGNLFHPYSKLNWKRLSIASSLYKIVVVS